MNAVVPLNQNTAPVRVHSSSVLADPRQFETNWRAAQIFANSGLVPKHYEGKPEACFIAINRAQRIGCDELYFLEKTFVLNGKLGLAAELAIELANGSGRFKGPITYHLTGEGEGRACTAKAVLAATGEPVENTVSYAMAKADGWTRNNKWTTLRDQMLQYRAGVFLARLYAGGAMGGLYTKEELEDIPQPAAAPSAPMIEHQPTPAAVILDAICGPVPARAKLDPADFWAKDKLTIPAKTGVPFDTWAARFLKACAAAPSWALFEKLCEDNIVMVDALAKTEHQPAFDTLRMDLMDKFDQALFEGAEADAEPETQEQIPF